MNDEQSQQLLRELKIIRICAVVFAAAVVVAALQQLLGIRF